MKVLLCICVCLIASAACGYSSSGNDLEGQVKKVIRKTPIICPDYYEADVSLGVMRNGVGSMSKEDVELYVDNDKYVEVLKLAAKTGAIITVHYDVKRIAWCVPDHFLTAVTIETGPGEAARQ